MNRKPAYQGQAVVLGERCLNDSFQSADASSCRATAPNLWCWNPSGRSVMGTSAASG
jgi:hypothetical protein